MIQVCEHDFILSSLFQSVCHQFTGLHDSRSSSRFQSTKISPSWSFLEALNAARNRSPQQIEADMVEKLLRRNLVHFGLPPAIPRWIAHPYLLTWKVRAWMLFLLVVKDCLAAGIAFSCCDESLYWCDIASTLNIMILNSSATWASRLMAGLMASAFLELLGARCC